jgi:hypothetical protein
LSRAKLGIFEGGYGGNLFGRWLVKLTDIVSLSGFILMGLFAIVLKIMNVNFKDN